MPLLEPVPVATASAQTIFEAVSKLCARARREGSASYFRMIDEMLPGDIARTAIADIRRLCRWSPDGSYSDFAYGQIDQMARCLRENDRLHLLS